MGKISTPIFHCTHLTIILWKMINNRYLKSIASKQNPKSIDDFFNTAVSEFNNM